MSYPLDPEFLSQTSISLLHGLFVDIKPTICYVISARRYLVEDNRKTGTVGDPYRLFAKLYDRIFEPLNGGLRGIGMSMFRPTNGMAVLDVGCGTGTHLDLYGKYECDLFGIDVSESMLTVARKKLGSKATLKLANATSIPYDPETFDLVICMLTLHEMNPELRSPVVKEIKRVVKKKGHILLIDFHDGPFRSIRGWVAKVVITVSELIAGVRHFQNYRRFMSHGGLKPLLDESALRIAKQKVVAGGGLVVYLLTKE